MRAVTKPRQSGKARKNRNLANIEKETYYYIRDSKNRPLITTCLIQSDMGTSRGLAICSPIEMPCKKDGRRIAKERALYALRILDNDLPINRSSAKSVVYMVTTGDKIFCGLTDAKWNFKSRFNPELSNFEMKLLDFVDKDENKAAA